MDKKQAEKLGRMLKEAREALGYSTYRLGELADMDQATVVRLEAGSITAPRPDKLSRLATALSLSAADLFALADYTVPTDLPSCKPYLRAKYSQLPQADIEKIEAFAADLAQKHGVNLEGPAPGEDE